jgi:phosphinothricin acetyltransferase
MIRNVKLSDASALAQIYNYYVKNTPITFEETPIAIDEMQARIEGITASLPWFVFETHKGVIGYAYANKWKTRVAYRYSVESTVYLDPTEIGKGIGKKLYSQLLSDLKARSVHCVIAGIALPNLPSVGLHEKCGFEKVAHFQEVGWKFETWIDVGYWEIILK